MTLFEVILLSFALAADAVTVGSAIGLSHNKPGDIFRVSFHFGLFQAIFPLIGAFAGILILHWVEKWDHWVVFAVLGLLGLRMILHALGKTKPDKSFNNPTRSWKLVGLSVAVSIDALGAGISLPTAQIGIPFSVILIGLITMLLTAVAMKTAAVLTRKLGNRLEIAGGLILIGVGTKILITHLT